jgi:hypothetical protein
MHILAEYGLALTGLIIGIIGFYTKRLYHSVDKNTQDIKQVAKELTDHRVHDASTFVSRTELDNKMFELKSDIRGMISASTQHIEALIKSK